MIKAGLPGRLSVARRRIDDDVGDSTSRVRRLVPRGAALIVRDSAHYDRGARAAKRAIGRGGYCRANGIGRGDRRGPDRRRSPVAAIVAPIVAVPMVIVVIAVDIFDGILALPLSIGALLLAGSLPFRALILTLSLPVGSSILAIRAYIASITRPLGT